MSDVTGDQLPEYQPLLLQQLWLLRPHIPAGQAHFTLITCADLRAGRGLSRKPDFLAHMTEGRDGAQQTLKTIPCGGLTLTIAEICHRPTNTLMSINCNGTEPS